MRYWTGITDCDWHRVLAAKPELAEVNFWQPGAGRQPDESRSPAAGCARYKAGMQRRALLWVTLVTGVLLAACGGAGSTASESTPPAPSASSVPSDSLQPTATASRTASPPPSAEPTASPVVHIAPDTLVETIVEGLTVRRDAGPAGERIGFLELGTLAYVLAGPVEADGLSWYRITGMGLPYASGCPTLPPDVPITCPAFQGWVAGAGESGDPWIGSAAPEPCPDPDLTTISELGFTWRLVCWADGPITFDAWWPEIPDDAGLGGVCPESDDPSGFLYCQHINYNQLAASPEEGWVGRLGLSIDPASELAMPERGQWIRVTGGFDHAAAAGCADLAQLPWEDSYAAVFRCRLEFVPTAIEPLGT